MYFVKNGDKMGKFLVVVDYDSKGKFYSVLLLPDGHADYVTEHDMNLGITNKYIDKVKRLPRSVSNTCKKEFIYKSKG